MTQLPPDAEAQREMVDFLRRRRRDGWVVDKLAEPPVHIAGCDDPHGLFDWYVMWNPQDRETPRGFFHLPKDVDL